MRPLVECSSAFGAGMLHEGNRLPTARWRTEAKHRH